MTSDTRAFASAAGPRATILTSVLLQLLFVHEAALAADAAAARAAAKALLEKGWDKSPTAHGLVNQEYRQAAEIAPDDPLLLAAHWLVLMHQGRHNEALESVHKFRKVKADYLPAIRAEVWIHTVKQDYAKALFAAEGLADAALAPPASAGKSPTASQQEAIAFLGRFSGFMAGPAEADVEEGLRKKLESKITSRLDEPRKKIFEDEKQGVLKKYGELTTAATAAGNDAKQAAEAEKQRKLGDLQKERDELAKEAEKAAEREKDALEAFRKKIGELDSEDGGLARSMINLNSQAATMSRQISALNDTANRLRGQANKEKNAGQRAANERQALQAENMANQLKPQLVGVNTMIVQSQGRRNEIAAKRQETIQAAQLQGLKLDLDRQGIDEDKRKNKNQQKRAERKKEGGSGKARAFDSRATAFRTYDTFPLEEIRANLQASLP